MYHKMVLRHIGIQAALTQYTHKRCKTPTRQSAIIMKESSMNKQEHTTTYLAFVHRQ